MAVGFFAITMALNEIVLGQFQDNREENQQLGDYVVDDMLPETFDLVPVVLDELRVRTLVMRDKLWNVVDFSVVVLAGHDLADPERFVTIVSAILEICAIFDLFLGREVEELFSDCKLPVDGFLAQTEVDDVEESWLEIRRCGSDLIGVVRLPIS